MIVPRNDRQHRDCREEKGKRVLDLMRLMTHVDAMSCAIHSYRRTIFLCVYREFATSFDTFFGQQYRLSSSSDIKTFVDKPRSEAERLTKGQCTRRGRVKKESSLRSKLASNRREKANDLRPQVLVRSGFLFFARSSVYIYTARPTTRESASSPSTAAVTRNAIHDFIKTTSRIKCSLLREAIVLLCRTFTTYSKKNMSLSREHSMQDYY